MLSMRIRRAAVAATATLALAAFATACEDTTKTSADKSSSVPASESKGKEAPSKSVADQLKEFAAKNGTAEEKKAVAHVTKVQGAEENNNILDAPEIHTDLKGDLMDSDTTGAATLIASVFADFQADRGKSSKNGLVTVYNASGDVIGNGKF